MTVLFPRGFFDVTDKIRFKRSVALSVARNMDAIDPISGKATKYGDEPDKFIDLVLLPYDTDDASVITPLLATIVTYEWPDRMADIEDRIQTITREVRQNLTLDVTSRYEKGAELISFTFLGKKPGAWAIA